MLPKTVRCLRILAPGSGVLLLGLLVACGGTADLSRAEAHLNGGRLEQAAALLQGSTGARARPLQQRLKTASEERAAAREELDAFLADLGGLDRAEVISGLREMSQRQDDPVVIGWIETEMSRADDLLADRDSTKRRETIDFDAARRERASERKRREEVQPAVGGQLSSDPVLDALLQDARRAAAASDWARALSILDMSLEELPFYRARLDDLERELVDLARLDADEVLAEAGRIEVSGGVQAALDYVDEQRTRFPDIPALEAFYEELDLIGVRSDIAVRLDAADPGVPEEAHEFDDLDDEALLARAREHELRGDYFEASRAWALLDSRGGTEHAEVQSLALVLRAKMAAEIHQAFGRDPAAFDGLVEEVAETGPTTVSGSLSWANTPLPLLIELGRAAGNEADVKLGIAFEKLARSQVDGPRGGLADLARATDRGWLESDKVWMAVAWSRAEPMPEGGYSFEKGAWISRIEQLAEARNEAVKKLSVKLKRARSEADRSELHHAFQDLAVESEVADFALNKTLGEMWQESWRVLAQSRSLTDIGRLVNDRQELDSAREHALELIFDSERYFYPYRPPACPPEKAKEYHAVQREVDVRVAAVRERWEAGRDVKLSRSLREALAMIEWLRGTPEVPRLGLALPEDLPDWHEGLGSELSVVNLHSFAWDAKERETRRYNAAVREWNEHLWSDFEGEDEEQASGGERDQVRITNDYRVMFGRRAVAWNPRLQVAAGWHSDYMALTGEFGHFESQNPERRTPFDRMRLAAYPRGASENCHMGSGSPAGAHSGWIHSSGHHRNILTKTHREMASAVSGNYWTQNFGTDDAFQSSLSPWQD